MHLLTKDCKTVGAKWCSRIYMNIFINKVYKYYRLYTEFGDYIMVLACVMMMVIMVCGGWVGWWLDWCVGNV